MGGNARKQKRHAKQSLGGTMMPCSRGELPRIGPSGCSEVAAEGEEGSH